MLQYKAGCVRVTHPYATLIVLLPFTVRLACVKHAASVRSEPGSNSQVRLVAPLEAANLEPTPFAKSLNDRYSKPTIKMHSTNSTS